MTTPGFTAAQAELVRARAASEAAQLAAGQAAERQKAIAGELDLLARSLDRNDDAAVAEQRRLQERAKRAETEAAAALADAQRADADAVAALGTFAIFTEPRQNAGG